MSDNTLKGFFKGLEGSAKGDTSIGSIDNSSLDILIDNNPKKSKPLIPEPYKQRCYHSYRYIEKKMALDKNGIMTNNEVYVFYCTKCLEFKLVNCNSTKSI